MMVISYVWGQKVYRVPYAWKKLTAYMVIVAVIWLVPPCGDRVLAEPVF
ncbi:hypothetical protein ACQ86N_48195 [Puia sp. P3]